jgi:hypothetical protein
LIEHLAQAADDRPVVVRRAGKPAKVPTNTATNVD